MFTLQHWIGFAVHTLVILLLIMFTSFETAMFVYGCYMLAMHFVGWCIAIYVNNQLSH